MDSDCFHTRKNNGINKGTTTGSCAAAAAKAAALFQIMDVSHKNVKINTPGGEVLNIPIAGYGIDGAYKICVWVRKDAGDDLDVTHGLLIGAQLKTYKSPTSAIKIRGGEGVGEVTEPGLPVDVGEAAINPTPRKMIEAHVREVLPEGIGAEITILVPGGSQIAENTLNAKLGIVQGISILGTTGIVEPMSEEALMDSLKLQLDQLHYQAIETIVLVPGRSGEKIAATLGVPKTHIVITNNYIGWMLKEAVNMGHSKIIIMGHVGKIAKLSAGIFNTHSKVADARREIFVAHAFLAGLPSSVIRQLWDAVTAERCVEILNQHVSCDKKPRANSGDNQGDDLLMQMASEAEKRVHDYLNNAQRSQQNTTVGVAFTDRKGHLLAHSVNTENICREAGWWLWEK